MKSEVKVIQKQEQQVAVSIQARAEEISRSDLVPKEFKGNPGNCLIAMELSQRVGVPPIMVMQNMNIIHGRPAWSSQFIISAINSSGKFSLKPS